MAAGLRCAHLRCHVSATDMVLTAAPAWGFSGEVSYARCHSFLLESYCSSTCFPVGLVISPVSSLNEAFHPCSKMPDSDSRLCLAFGMCSARTSRVVAVPSLANTGSRTVPSQQAVMLTLPTAEPTSLELGRYSENMLLFFMMVHVHPESTRAKPSSCGSLLTLVSCASLTKCVILGSSAASGGWMSSMSG